MNMALHNGHNGDMVKDRGMVGVVSPPSMLNLENDGNVVDMNFSPEAPGIRYGEELRSFWVEDGYFKGVCKKCGRELADTTQVRYRETPWIGVDLDGTLACDVGTWRGGTIGRPIAPMMARVKKWLAEGITVKVFTARASSPQQVVAIKKWLARHGLSDLEVTNVKDRLMIELWDDRCVQVSYNAGQPVSGKKTGCKRNTKSSLGRWMSPVGILSRIKILFTL